MRRKWVAAIIAVAAIGVLAAISWAVSYRVHVQVNERFVEQSASFSAVSLRARIGGFASLAELLSRDAQIVQALESVPDGKSAASASEQLNRTIFSSGADMAHLLDGAGNVVASSGWIGLASLPKMSLSFRPYFAEALRNGRAIFHGLDTISHRPASYYAVRVETPSGVHGVVVVQFVSLPGDRSTLGPDTSIALADSAGMVFLTNRDEWRFRPLQALSPDDLDRIARSRQFDGVPVERFKPLLVDDGAGGLVPEWQGGLVAHTEMVDEFGLTLIIAKSLEPARFAATAIAALVALFGIIVAGLVLIYLQNRELERLRAEQSALLEKQVEERTRELAEEISIRRRTEQNLRETEQDLVQAAKLAALGQMSAALAHEVSQPVTALAATLKAVERRLEAGETASAGELVARAQSLIWRIQHIIRHLRSFSKKDRGEASRMALAASVKAALELVETRAREIGVTISTAGLDRHVEVMGNPVRLEQVLVNLLLNALDAVTGQVERAVGIILSTGDNAATIAVWDTGPGMPEELAKKLSEPFVTTKADGYSIGLGLSISQSILNDFGGAMHFEPRQGGGTVCVVTLPLAVTGEGSEAAE
ncbi:MAG: hypothetical protein KKH72_02690 [Alphaproteobacteria bacterium]|nr:hypothetical protein [Alphaproteobacteria bacterium]